MHLCHATPVENAIAIFLSVKVFEWGLASNVASKWMLHMQMLDKKQDDQCY